MRGMPHLLNAVPIPRLDHSTLPMATTLTRCSRCCADAMLLHHYSDRVHATGVFVIFCFSGVALAVAWASQPRPAKTLRRFNGLWKERVALEVFGGVWLVRHRLARPPP